MKKLFISLITASLLMSSYPAHALDIKWEKKHSYIIVAAAALLGLGIYAAIKGRQEIVRDLGQAQLNAKLYREEQERRERQREELVANRPNTTIIITNELPTPANFEFTINRNGSLAARYPKIDPRQGVIDSERTVAFQVPTALRELSERQAVSPILSIRAQGMDHKLFSVDILDKKTTSVRIKPKQIIDFEQIYE